MRAYRVWIKREQQVHVWADSQDDAGERAANELDHGGVTAEKPIEVLSVEEAAEHDDVGYGHGV